MNTEGKGKIRDTAELGALTAAASLIAPKQASTILEQSNRFLSGSNQKWGGLLKKFGVADKDSLGQGLEKMFVGFEKIEAGGGDPIKAMQAAGFDQAEAQQRIMGMYNKRDMIRAAGKSASSNLTAADTAKEIADRTSKDGGLQLQMAKTQGLRLQAEQALKNQDAALVEQLAENQLISQGIGKGSRRARWPIGSRAARSRATCSATRQSADMRFSFRKKSANWRVTTADDWVNDVFTTGRYRRKRAARHRARAQGKLGNRPGQNILDRNPIDPLAATKSAGNKGPKPVHIFSAGEQQAMKGIADEATLKVQREIAAYLKSLDAKTPDTKNIPHKIIQANGGRPAFH